MKPNDGSQDRQWLIVVDLAEEGAVDGSSANGQAPQRASEKWIDRIELAIATVLQLAILFVVVTAFFDRLWLIAFSGLVVFMLTFAPAVIERQLRVRLPIELTLFTCVFLFASFALGEVGHFYDRIWWWDILLHATSAVVIGLIGFIIIYVFYMTYRVRVAPVYVAVITFGFAMTIGSLWEIFEFLMDWFFDLNMQRSGLLDTMTDLMVNATGALIAATIGFYYLHHEDELLGRRLISTLIERNRKRARSGFDSTKT